MQKLILIITAVVLASTNAAAQVKEFDGPYGMKALVVDRKGEKVFAWKIPHTDAKLLFFGSVYDGKENLTWRFSRKLLGPDRLKADVVGMETNVQEGKKLYIFFDPGCDTCQLLYRKFSQEPAGCTLVWVPIQIIKDDSQIELGHQWLLSAMPEAVQRWGVVDAPDRYQKIKDKNYAFVKWLKGTGEPLSVPMFVWMADGGLELKEGLEMIGGKLGKVMKTLKENK